MWARMGSAMSTILRTSIPPSWSTIRVARDSVRQALAEYAEVFVRAAVMTASELLENAIKYGENVPGASEGLLTISIAENRIEIETVNGSTDRESVHQLLDHVRLIKEANNKETLYQEQLKRLMASSDDDKSTQLGLYRIACEGGFDLDCTYSDAIVTVTATRRIS